MADPGGLDAYRSGFGAGDQVVSDRQDQPVARRTRSYISLLLGDDVNGRNQGDYGRIAPVVADEGGGYVRRAEPVYGQVELSLVVVHRVVGDEVLVGAEGDVTVEAGRDGDVLSGVSDFDDSLPESDDA